MNKQEDFTIFIVPLPVEMEDDIQHTSANPFCNDFTCECHQDKETYAESIRTPLYSGLLSIEEAARIYGGLQQAA